MINDFESLAKEMDMSMNCAREVWFFSTEEYLIESLRYPLEDLSIIIEQGLFDTKVQHGRSRWS